MPDDAQPQLDTKYDYAKLPDGSYAKFPKGTNPIVMQAKLAQAGLIKPKPYTGPVKAAKPDYQLPAYLGFTPKNVAKNLYEGGKAVVKGSYELGKDVLSNKPLFFGKDSTANKYIGNPGAQQLAKAHEDWKANRLLEASAHFVAAHIPFIGPAAANLGEQAGTGDIGGATGQAVGMLAAGKAMSKTVDVAKSFVDPTLLKQRAADLDTKVLKTAKEGVPLDQKTAVGLQVANEHIVSSLKDLPAKIEQVRLAKNAKVEALAKFHDAQGHIVDAESGLAKPLSIIAQRLNTRGLLDETSMKAIRSELNKLQTKIDMRTGKPVPRNLKTMTVRDALELTKGLGEKIHWDAATEAAVEPFRKTIRQVINDAIDKVDPEIGKTRGEEHRLIEARDAADKQYTAMKNDKLATASGIFRSGAPAIATWLGLRALGLMTPVTALGSVIVLKTLAESTLSRTARAALYARAADLLERTMGTAQAPLNAAGGPQVQPRAGGPTLPQNAPKLPTNATAGQPTASPTPSGLSAMPPAPTAATAPRSLTLPESATRARAGSGDYVKGTSGARSTSKSIAIEPTDLQIRRSGPSGPKGIYIGYDASQDFVNKEIGAGHIEFARKMFPGKDIVDARAVRQEFGGAVRGKHGLHIEFKNAGDAQAALDEIKGETTESTSRNKAMLDRLDTLYARKPRSGAENVAIKREIDEIKKVLSGEAKGADAAAINKRIADRERLAEKRSTTGAVQKRATQSASGEAVAQGASPEMRAIVLDAGYKAIAKYPGGNMMAKQLQATAKAMQKIDPSYDEVEKLTEALQILKSLPPDKD